MARYQDRKHPYLKGPVFWEDPRNQYWKSPLYTKKGQDYLDNMVVEMRKNEKQLVKLQS